MKYKKGDRIILKLPHGAHYAGDEGYINEIGTSIIGAFFGAQYYALHEGDWELKDKPVQAPFKVGDWVYAEKGNGSDDFRKKGKFTPVFKIEEIYGGGNGDFLRPQNGIGEGVDRKICRHAAPHEIPGRSERPIEDIMEEARRRFPPGTRYISPEDGQTYIVMQGANFRASSNEKDILVQETIDRSQYVYYVGRWAEIVGEEKPTEDLLAEAKRRYPIGCWVYALISGGRPISFKTCIKNNEFRFYASSLISNTSIPGYLYAKGVWAPMAFEEYVEIPEIRPQQWAVAVESSVEHMPREVILERKRKGRRELV